MTMQNMIVLFVILQSEILLATMPAADDLLAQFYRDARIAQQAGDLATATEKYERIVGLRPDLAEAYANLGVLYHQQRKIEKASNAFRKAIGLKPALSGPHFFLGTISFDARRYDDAAAHLTRAEKLEPSNFLIQLYLGFNCYARSQYLAAVQHFENSVALDGMDSDAFYHLSKSYGQMSKQSFSLLQKTHPDSIYVDLARAHFFETDQQWDAAREEYSRALEKAPNKDRLRKRLNWVTEKAAGTSGSPPEESASDEVIDGSVRFLYAPPAGEKVMLEIHRYQDRIYKLRSEKEKSAQTLHGLAEGYQILSYLTSLWVLQVAPDSHRAHHLKGQYYEALNKDEEAITEYRQAVQMKPDLQNVYFLIGNIYWKKGEMEKALPELLRELSVNPNHPQALYELADILYEQGKWQEAEAKYLKALKLEPNMEEAHLALEKIYSQNGRADLALNHLGKAIQINRLNPTPHYRMSLIFKKLGRSLEADREMKIFQHLKAKESQR